MTVQVDGQQRQSSGRGQNPYPALYLAEITLLMRMPAPNNTAICRWPKQGCVLLCLGKRA